MLIFIMIICFYYSIFPIEAPALFHLSFIIGRLTSCAANSGTAEDIRRTDNQDRRYQCFGAPS